jgi:transcriptional regulator with XRE-family HTH domain
MANAALPFTSKRNLWIELSDQEYRHGFVEAQAKDTIAFQLRAMRKERNWEQRDVATQMGLDPKFQSMISRYENPDYGKFSLATLLKLAEAFDVGLAVRFVPFSELIDWDDRFSRDKAAPKTFLDEFSNLFGHAREENQADTVRSASHAYTASAKPSLGSYSDSVKGGIHEVGQRGSSASSMAFRSTGTQSAR